jgi:hypothetical protein
MSARVDRVLDRLKAQQVQHALDSTLNPKNRDSFEYGRVVGFAQGLRAAEELLLQDDRDEKQKDVDR